MKVQDPLFKIVENFKMVKTEHKSKCEALLNSWVTASVARLYSQPIQSPVCLCVSSLGGGCYWLLFTECEGDNVPSDQFPGNSWAQHRP